MCEMCIKEGVCVCGEVVSLCGQKAERVKHKKEEKRVVEADFFSWLITAIVIIDKNGIQIRIIIISSSPECKCS